MQTIKIIPIITKHKDYETTIDHRRLRLGEFIQIKIIKQDHLQDLSKSMKQKKTNWKRRMMQTKYVY
jgi:hypothetical protein